MKVTIAPGRESVAVAVLANSQQVAQSFRYPPTIRRQFDILQFRPGWRGSNAIRSIETTRVHHAARRRCGRMADCCAGAAGDEKPVRHSLLEMLQRESPLFVIGYSLAGQVLDRILSF